MFIIVKQTHVDFTIENSKDNNMKENYTFHFIDYGKLHVSLSMMLSALFINVIYQNTSFYIDGNRFSILSYI